MPALPVYPTAEPFLPQRVTLKSLRQAAAGCEGCDLFQRATQTVFGEGPARARIMMIGEQPGDQEDKQGRPFVGPAGRILDQALQQAGIARDDVYVTNAVKHFKWTPRGKRRLHSKPSSRQIAACKPWLTAEIQVVRPQVVVALGATAAQTLMGSIFRITRDRGRLIEGTQWGWYLLATVHPSSLLRIPETQGRREALEEFAEDLRIAVGALGA